MVILHATLDAFVPKPELPLKEGQKDILRDRGSLERIVIESIIKHFAVEIPLFRSHQDDDDNITVVALLNGGTHITLHTYPEKRVFVFDIVSGKIDPRGILQDVSSAIGGSGKVQVAQRAG
jgi:S-adenosylmethionine/arginine decarboxylase-like enzyme